MIPFKDENPTERFPFFTILFIVINIAVYALQVIYSPYQRQIVYSFGAIPYLLLTFQEVQPIHPLMSLFTSMFMHGGLLHLAGNMLYLWIFGNNIEDQLGHVRFVLFYLISGVIAVYCHALTAPHSTIPMIGASGAVSGVLGAYIVLFPYARVHTLLIIGFFIQVVKIPALIVIGLWFFIQVINVLVSTGFGGAQGGVAWFAHIGGFVAGIVMIKIFLKRIKRKKRRYYNDEW